MNDNNNYIYPWDIWITWNDNGKPPDNVLVIAYGFNDTKETEYVGYAHELRKKIPDDYIIWKLTGIAREQLGEKG